MSKFEALGLKGGLWQGVLHREEEPARLVLTHLGDVVSEGRATSEGPSLWRVSVPIPIERISDGIQTFVLLEDQGQGREAAQPGAIRLGSLPLIAGETLDEDLAAEISLLKAEIELLKREFRRVAVAQRAQ